MSKLNSLLKLTALAALTSGLAACGGSSSDTASGLTLLTCSVPQIPNADNTMCVDPPPIQCDVPLVPNETNDQCVAGVDPNAPPPFAIASERQAILFYNRVNVGGSNDGNDESYDGYRAHLWNNDTCDAYADDEVTSWDSGKPIDGFDPNYGAYWIIELREGFGDCGNFIVHVGTDDAGKEHGGGDMTMSLVEDENGFSRMNFTFSGNSTIFDYPIASLGPQPLQVADAKAHWIDMNTFVFDVDTDRADTVRLHYSPTAAITPDPDTGVNGTVIDLTPADQTEAQMAVAPQTAEWPTFTAELTAEQAKLVAKSQAVLVAYDVDGEPFDATSIQTGKALDAIYTSGDSDADEADLGIVYDNGIIQANVWAPTAQAVNLVVYDADKTQTNSFAMTEDTETGIWSYNGDASLDRMFYRYEVTTYRYDSDEIETMEVTDPYSISLSTNGIYSQFVNLDDADLKPTGWDEHSVPTVVNPEDMVIYEGHIRDFSIRDESTMEENRGKYLAFTETNSTPVTHLKALADAGMTHFQVLPANDIATVDERENHTIDLNSTVAELCELNESAAVCGVESDDATILSLYESYDAFSNDAKNLTQDIRSVDRFNWGYDPKHFNVPEGSYSSNPDGVARILEMRSMVQALHETGLRVSLDVVYNHTNSAGAWQNSVLDKVVPGYYHDRDITTGAVKNGTCCSDTALEHRMMDKLMVDSLIMWAGEYKYDAFRFDIMSHGTKAQMLAARQAVQATDADTYFYGEGWGQTNRGYEHAGQSELAGEEIGTFNDRLRDGVRSADLFANDDTIDGPFLAQDRVKFGLAGTLSDYVLKSFRGTDTAGSAHSPSMYAQDPADVINYVSKHDNETLWDILQLELDMDISLEERIRIQNIAATLPLVSQGIPFLQMGGDLIRSKSMDRNSYDSGDWYNYVDFTKQTNNWNVGLPMDFNSDASDTEIVNISTNSNTTVTASEIDFASMVFQEFLSIRSASPLFRLTTAESVIERVGFHNIGRRQTQGLIVMSLDDGSGLTDLDPATDAIVVVMNTGDSEKSHTVATATGFELHAIQQDSVDEVVKSASFAEGEGEGTFTVPPYTTAIFVKPQGEVQGEGLAATATAGAPDVVPFGDTTVLLRGDMNGWGETDALSYMGNGIYQIAVEMTAGTYNFKIASADWATVNFGAVDAASVLVEEGVAETLAATNDNLQFVPTIDATWIFEVDASDAAAPILTIRNEEPYPGTVVYVRGDMNGWGTSDAMTYIGGGQYMLTVTLEAGSVGFKIASEDWATVNLGSGEADAGVDLNREELLGSPGENMTLNVAEAGEYTFLFDASNANELELSVFNSRMFGEVPVYLRGDMNSWGTSDELSYDGNSTYSITVALAAQSYGFKVASEDWSTYNLGAESADVVFGETASLVQNSQTNFALTVAEAGSYKFTVSGPNPTAPALTVTKVD